MESCLIELLSINLLLLLYSSSVKMVGVGVVEVEAVVVEVWFLYLGACAVSK
jgi:hypothetical protein